MALTVTKLEPGDPQYAEGPTTYRVDGTFDDGPIPGLPLPALLTRDRAAAVLANVQTAQRSAAARYDRPVAALNQLIELMPV